MPGVDRRTVIKGAAAAADADDAELHWPEGATPDAHAGTTWGVPWARGAYRPQQRFGLTTAAAGDDVPVRSRVTGHWPDGSVKWTAHAIAPGAPKASAYRLAAGSPAAPSGRCAWNAFCTGGDSYFPSNGRNPVTVKTPAVLRATEEIPS
ncbi:RIFT barrel domain-containing protein [Streptomyces sp. NPDC002817]|uniref:RIFT barrel domain-containing protein n=1 Tax=Streptomyces sp. NPDC088357 TaxID=3154655 RepID=UPI003412A0C4